MVLEEKLASISVCVGVGGWGEITNSFPRGK